MIPLLIRLPFAAVAIFLLLKMKMVKAFSPKKKAISIMITGLIALTIISAVPFDYYLFRFNSPQAAISYSMTEPKIFDVAGIVSNGDAGDYVIINTRSGYESHYLEKADKKWRMVKQNTKWNFKGVPLNYAVINYKHNFDEEIVAVELYYPFDDGTAADKQVSDNKGTKFQTFFFAPNSAGERPVLFCGLYAFDNQPYELYINGELVFSYSESL